jgi:hypothetical protein
MVWYYLIVVKLHIDIALHAAFALFLSSILPNLYVTMKNISSDSGWVDDGQIILFFAVPSQRHSWRV